MLQSQLATLDQLVDANKKLPGRNDAEKLKKSVGYKRILTLAEKRFKSLKESKLRPSFRRTWRGGHARWMAATLVLDEDGNARFPSLLGSGGNDGNLEVSNNFLQRLALLFETESDVGVPRVGSSEMLSASLWESTYNIAIPGKIGQFMPGNAGGANLSNGAVEKESSNPWDFVLMVEGSIMFRGRSSRVFDVELCKSANKSLGTAPFSVHPLAAGHASPGTEKDVDGEQWMPLWRNPASVKDLEALLGEGRMQIGKRTATRPVDAALAISRLGNARGIEEFVRYGFLERFGQSNFAVPHGRVHVRDNPRSHLIGDVAAWMNKLQRLARESHAPARLIHAERRIADAVFGALTHDYSASRWRAILEAAADVEIIQAAGTAFEAGPIPKLKPAWVSAIYDASDDTSAREVRLALALASGNSPQQTYLPVRHHFLPLKPHARQFNTSDKRLANDPQVVVTGRDAIADCGELVLRRFIDAGDDSRGYFALEAAPWCGVTLPDLAALIDGHVDLARVVKLARALMALVWKAWSKNRDGEKHFPASNPNGDHPEEAWLAIRLACLPWPIDSFEIKAEHSMVRRLLAGDGFSAAEIAKRRLRSSGLRVPFESALADEQTSRLWAAALAFPISKSTAQRAVKILCPQVSGEVHA